MKKYYKIITCITLAIGLFSCNSFLEENPKVLQAPENFYNTISDLEAGINSITWTMFESDIPGEQSRLSMPGAARSFQMHMGADDLTTKSDGTKTQWITIDQFNPTPATIFIETAAWNIPYRVINQCNNILEVKDQIQGDQNEINKLVSLAYFWRGWAHFYASRFYGDVVIKTTTESWEDTKLSRSPVLDVYKQVEKDLLEALKYLPPSWGPEKSAYPNASALKTLLADFYITWAGWPIKDETKYVQAANYAQDVMMTSGASLLPDFADLWKYDLIGTYDDSPEHIWSIVYLTTEQIGTNDRARAIGRQFIQPEERNGFADFFSEIGFFNSFPAGYRKNMTFKTVHAGVQWQNNSEGHPYYRKYRGSYDFGNSRNAQSGADFMVYRYADVLLLYAEAKAMSTGPDATAYEAINKVRRRANNLPINTPNVSVDLTPGLGKIAFRDAVIDERAWEFAAEQRRWYDLIRTEKLAQSVANKDVNDIQPSSVTPLLDGGFFPIPFREVQNSGNVIKQNLGY